MNQLAPGEGLRPQVEPQLVEYGELKAIKDAGNLIPGQWYRITDYVTTVNGNTETNARSAGHAFDVLVMATDAGTLSEDALAVRHDGDTYFENSRLEAWELKFRLENEKWSKQKGTYVVDEENGYSFIAIGTIELGGHTYQLLQGLGTYVEDLSDYALMDSLEVGETIYCYYGDPEDFDPEEPEKVGTASAVDVVTEEGKGTILWMKDEFGNECPYDFKNIQFKRWKATDAISGREGLNGLYMVAEPDNTAKNIQFKRWKATGREGLNGLYMVAEPDNTAKNLSVDDTEDYIWAYTFSSDNSGGDQTDFSLGGHNVHDNVFKPYGDLLPNNVMFGGDNYGNSFGSNCNNNSWGNGCSRNSWGNSCENNSWGNGCSSNSWGNFCYNNSWGNDCNSNSWGDEVTYSTVFDGVQYTQITTTKVKFVQVLNGVQGTSSSKLTLTFAANKTYTQVAAKTSAGALKIYVPGDLA